MPRNGSGAYSLPQPPFVAGTVISSAAVNSDLSDIAAALTGSLPRDGQAGMLGQFKATDGSTIAPSISFTNETNTGFFRIGVNKIGIVVNGVTVGVVDTGGIAATVPVGTILDYGGIGAPARWLLCYGQAISRSTYSLLFAAIGTNFGNGDGSTTFNLPDFRGTFSIFSDSAFGNTAPAGRMTTFFGGNPNNIGSRGGAQSAALGPANMAAHAHGVSGTTGNDSPDHVHPFTTAPEITGVPPAIIGGGGSFPANPFSGNTGGASTRHQHPFSATTDNGGLSNPGAAFGIVPPALVVAKMIFAGV